MHKLKINIAKDFTSTPGPRYKKEGHFSGELFRDEHLFPKISEAIENNLKLEVNLDGTAGYGTSFLEEAFGGLIRENKITREALLNHLEFISVEEDYLIDDIKFYIEDASKKRQ